MSSTLIFPDGVRLAREDEIPGSNPRHSETWTRVQSAHIVPGFVLHDAEDERFAHYVEINVNAPHIWAVFCDLCQALLGPNATFIVGDADSELAPVASARVLSIIAALEPHSYQLAHDGFLQYGLMSDRDGTLSGVLVAPEKHFKVWMNDEECFRQVMQRHEIRETDHLEFLDEYPRIMVALPANAVVFHSLGDIVKYFEGEIAGVANGGA